MQEIRGQKIYLVDETFLVAQDSFIVEDIPLKASPSPCTSNSSSSSCFLIFNFFY